MSLIQRSLYVFQGCPLRGVPLHVCMHIGENYMSHAHHVISLSLLSPSLLPGQEIALKVESEGSNRHLWMNCSHSGCRLDGCPGNRFKPEKHDVCTDHVYTLLKLDCSNGKQAMVGDEVVLRKHLQGSAETVYCGLSGQCRAMTECDVDGQFDREACLDQILLLKVPEKENGSFLLHKDELTLRYAYRDGRLDESERGSWLDCDDGGERVCKRSDCPLGPNETGGVNGASHLVEKCQQDRFVVYKL